MNCQDQLLPERRPAATSTGAGFSSNAASGWGRSHWATCCRPMVMPRRPRSPTGVNPLAPKAPHHAAKAKRVLFLFMAGRPAISRCSTTSRNWRSSTARCRPRS